MAESDCITDKQKTGFVILELMLSMLIITVSIFVYMRSFTLTLNAYRYADNNLEAMLLLENDFNMLQLGQPLNNFDTYSLNNNDYQINRSMNTDEQENRIAVSHIRILWFERNREKKFAARMNFLKGAYE
ncbi:MAG: hypothetical protein ABH952_10450 [Candidatus Omnitrophota bacterium]